MNKKINKLALNKQIVANLNDVRGGECFTIKTCLTTVFEPITFPIIVKSIEKCFSGDARGLCKTDLCTVSQDCANTDYMSCYGGSCAKCG